MNRSNAARLVRTLLATVFPCTFVGICHAEELSLDLRRSVVDAGCACPIVLPGDDIQLEFQTENVSDVIGTGVTVSYTWPDGLEFIDATSQPAAMIRLDSHRGVLEWYLDDLYPGNGANAATLLVTARVRESAVGSVDFTAAANVFVDNVPANIPVDFVVLSNDMDGDASNDRASGNVLLPAVGNGDDGGGAFGMMFLSAISLLVLLRLRRRCWFIATRAVR